jgi:hypothetical protein
MRVPSSLPSIPAGSRRWLPASSFSRPVPNLFRSCLKPALRDVERLQRLRSQAYERVCSWFPLAMSVSVLRAAAVEVVGHPVPANFSLGRTGERRAETSDRWTPAAQAGDPEVRSVSRALSDARLELIGVGARSLASSR